MATDSIRKFSAKKPPTKVELAEFRNYVSQLKAKGIITGKVSAKSARPAFVRGGKSLAEIVNKNHDKLKPFQSKRSLSPVDRKSFIKVRDVPGIKGKSLATVFKEMEADPVKFNALKRPDELWGFRIDGTDSRRVYNNIDDLIDDGFRYDAHHASHDIFHKRSKSSGLFSKIELVRWKGTHQQWFKQRKTRTAKQKFSNAQRMAVKRRKKK